MARMIDVANVLQDDVVDFAELSGTWKVQSCEMDGGFRIRELGGTREMTHYTAEAVLLRVRDGRLVEGDALTERTMRWS
jgi:hypothetical protein